ncbi:MAG TPA: hypothetical protein VF217_11425 [Rhodanobacteraceae bacterium]
MKRSRVVSMASALLCVMLSLAAAAGDPAPKGWLVLRDGAANTDANYNKEDKDINGKLQGVSVLCAATGDNAQDVQALIATDQTRAWGANPGRSRVSTIVNLGGQVVTDPMPNNPRHCLINGLTLPQIKGVWHF